MDARGPDQVAADAAEADTVQRYLRQRQVAELLGDVGARDEARCRLENALRLISPRR